jgi:hypothetical protein
VTGISVLKGKQEGMLMCMTPETLLPLFVRLPPKVKNVVVPLGSVALI